MPKEKKENLIDLYAAKSQNQSMMQKNSIKIKENKDISNITNQKSNKNLPFKNPAFISKFKNKEKSSRSSKTQKNLIMDNLDSISLNICIYI